MTSNADTSIKLSPFATCIKGHPTKTKEDFIYDNSNRRHCRKCVEEENSKKRKR